MTKLQHYTLGLALALPALTATAGEEKTISLAQVPEAVMTALKEKLPEATVLSANTEAEDNGTLIYEVQGTLKDGRKFELDAEAQGQIEEIEIIFPEYMVPGAVMKAIQRKLEGFKPTLIEASHSPSMKVMSYEFEGMLGDKKMDIEVSADGRKIEIADS